MTVYVDEPFDYGSKGKWCHLATDADDMTELHELAARIGIKRRWFQDHPQHPHYDLTPSKRKQAIAQGAVPVSRMELARKCSKLLKEVVEMSDLHGDLSIGSIKYCFVHMRDIAQRAIAASEPAGEGEGE